ncbi:hypothetical protein [Paraburkholderia fynbosensis]|uniref:Uncharacterized protein n=1 Tax=Paraburkholderia fynbosensis TaxID=1200993 RepID=A0A6J5FMI8_9BURK|nr:hypothetical protein [Paraburkholderia fynbosensis]CAB3780764.1 hypothetical protein LMG27177_00995 [Paraburkholderia fynbosensis]
MSRNSEDSPFAMIVRLWCTLVACFWILLFLSLPLLALFGIAKAAKYKREAKHKIEKKYWSNQIVQCGCLLYIAVNLYAHIFQDFLHVGFERQRQMMGWFDTVMGLPGLIWYIFTDRAVANSGDSSQFLFVTFYGVLILLFFSMFLDYCKVYGRAEWGDGHWEAPDRVNRARIAKREKRFARQHALSAEWHQLQCAHPRNLDQWAELSKAEREAAIEIWDETADVLWKKLEQENARLREDS